MMLVLKTPRGLPVNVPEFIGEDSSERFSLNELVNAKLYYEENGYVIFEKIISPSICEKLRGLWNSEIKPYKGFIYRQATAKAEKHSKNANGWVMNPILNLQSINPSLFRNFREFSVESIFNNKSLTECFKSLLNETPKIVQSMYFEGNSATWEHQDSYYLDSEKIGEMTAAWIALEDISASAGRFFICPRSHKIQLQKHGLENNIAQNHESYISSVVREIKDKNLDIKAPLLKQGDVLFWNALTIHGSLDSQDSINSRSSITCHAIPKSRKFLQLQTRKIDLPVENLDNSVLYRPKDLAKFKNKIIFLVETKLPTIFYFFKKKAIILIMKFKRMD